MRTTKFVALGILAALASTGCQSVREDRVREDRGTAAPRCAALESRNWSAWIDRMPGPGASPTLRVQGEIDLPTPGYQAQLRAGRADRSAVPTQQLILELKPPQGMVSQVVQTRTVTYQGPAIAARYRGIDVLCAGRVITTISDVRDAR